MEKKIYDFDDDEAPFNMTPPPPSDPAWTLPDTGEDHSLELVGSDLLLGC